MKRKNKIICMLIVMMVALTACGPIHYEHSFTIKTSYREWVKEIGLFSRENIKVQKYEEENNSIYLRIEYFNGLAGYKELCEIVSAHNKFVDENPDYFPEDIDIIIQNIHGTSDVVSSFYNNANQNYSGCTYLGELNREHTAKMQFMAIGISSGYTELEYSDDVEIDVPVVILSNSYINLPSESDYAFFKECKNAEQIIIDFSNVEYDANEVSKSIKKYLPDVEVFDVVTIDKQDHIEKVE